MNNSDFELISAYLDNELDADTRSQVEKRLADDDAFAAIFVELDKQDNALKSHFSEIDNKPVPDDILRLLKIDSGLTTRSAQAANDPKWYKKTWFSIAASTLFVAILLPFLVQNDDTQIDSNISALLNSKVSGEIVSIDQSVDLYLSMSFTNHQGNWCREYYLISKTVVQTIACKSRGVWATEVQGDASLPTGAVFMPAGTTSAPEIETWLDHNMQSDPMSPSQELGWVDP